MEFKKILLTGSDGFIGSALMRELSLLNFDVRATVRNKNLIKSSNVFYLNITPHTDWSNYLTDVSVVIHTAGLAHISKYDSLFSLDKFRTENVNATINLANQAANHGVKRFIYISSIKVLGEKTDYGIKFSSESCYRPSDYYGISKMESEIGLIEISKSSELDVVIVRPPLVYGPGVKANFLKLLKISSAGIPLPFMTFSNKRSMVSIDNLTNFIILCVHSPNAANQIFMVSDDFDISIADLVKKLHFYFGYKPMIFPLPKFLLKSIFSVLGKSSEYSRLTNSLEIDIEKSKLLLGWVPLFDIDKCLKDTVNDFIRSHKV